MSETLRLLAFNDVYELESVDGVGGLAEMASLLAMHRKQYAANFTVV